MDQNVAKITANTKLVHLGHYSRPIIHYGVCRSERQRERERVHANDMYTDCCKVRWS